MAAAEVTAMLDLALKVSERATAAELISWLPA
jgi:hypothetical protein